jgi:hypothetical protein
MGFYIKRVGSIERWNPQNPLRDLIKAAALIAAEIDRLKRLEKQKGGGK